MSAAHSSDSEKQRGEEKQFHPPRLSLWHSERYLPCKDLDISPRALITSWNMNKSAESERSPAELLLTGIDWYRGGRKGRSGGPRGATLYWSSVNLVKRSRLLPQTGRGCPRWSSESVWFFPNQSKRKKNPALSIIHVSLRMLDGWIDAATSSSGGVTAARRERQTEIFETEDRWLPHPHRSTTLKAVWYCKQQGAHYCNTKMGFLMLI